MFRGSVISLPAKSVSAHINSELLGAIFFFNFPKILFTDSPIFTDFSSDNLMIEITYFIINYFIKSSDLMGQVLLSSLINTGSSGKLFLNFLPLRNISPDFFSCISVC